MSKINLHDTPPDNLVLDVNDSFIDYLEKRIKQNKKSVLLHDPSVHSHIVDGYLQGKLDETIQILESYKEFLNG